MKRLFLCLGSMNEGDMLALEICDSLKGRIKDADFARCEDPFEIPDHFKGGREVVIIDVVKGLKKARIFDGVDDFARTKSVTAHDLDACTVLKLLETADKRKFRIIGVPISADMRKAPEDVERLISSM